MTKAELIDAVAMEASLTKKAAVRAVDSMATCLTVGLVKGDVAVLPGIGKFVVKIRPAREGRNPTTGESIKISAGKRVVFRPAKTLKDAVA